MEISHTNPERQFLLRHLRLDKRIVRAEAHCLYDERGVAYLDFLAQYGAVPFGHNPPALWQALEAVRDGQEPSLVQPLSNVASEQLARALIEVAPGSMRYVTFTNSGAESVEAGIKLARACTGRRTIVSTTTGFHGKTSGAAAATGNPVYRRPFLVDETGFVRVPFNDLEALAVRLQEGDVAAFLVEAVQGEGGMQVADGDYLTEAARLCRAHGALLMLDEVQTGLGRTGRLFAADHYGIEPDILLLAKALGGGLVPLGACLCSEAVWTQEFGYHHSSTFANNHLTCTVGLATLQCLRAGNGKLVQEVERRGAYLRAKLEDLVQRYADVYTEVRGLGLMQGLVLAPWSGEHSYFLGHASQSGNAVALLCGYLFNRHRILTAPVFNHSQVLRLEPPLTVERHEIDRLVAALEEAAVLLRQGDHAGLLGYLFGARPDRSRLHHPVHNRPRAPAAYEQQLGRFAFLMHPPDFDDLVQNEPPSFAALNRQQRRAWQAWLGSWSHRAHDPSICYHLPALRSQRGGYVEGWLIACPLTPSQMMRLDRRSRARLVENYLEIARGLEVDMVGLGAFTSIITRGGTDIADCGLNVTTGNSLTAIASAESLIEVATSRGIEAPELRTGVVGAAGSVGRLVCRHLARRGGSLVLFGNPNNPRSIEGLKALAGELLQDALRLWLHRSPSGIGLTLAQGLSDPFGVPTELILSGDPLARGALFERLKTHFDAAGIALPVSVSLDLEADLPGVSALITATSQGGGFIDPSVLADGTIVCDVARPSDIASRLSDCGRDVLVYEGGLMRLPERIRLGNRNVVGLPAGVGLACLAETMVLTMAGERRHASLGAEASYEDAVDIHALARHHGFHQMSPRRPSRTEPEVLSPAIVTAAARPAVAP